MGERLISPWLNWPHTPRRRHVIINPYRFGSLASVLFVCGNSDTPEATGEQSVIDYLALLGYRVTLRDESDVADWSQDLVVIGRDCVAANVGTKYSAFPAGVLIMGLDMIDDMRLHASAAAGSDSSSIFNLATNHYIVQDFGASSSISYSSSVSRVRFASATLPAGVIKLAQSGSGGTGTNPFPTLVKAAAGATLTSGTAEGRRVAWGNYQFEAAGANSKTIFRRAMEWLSGTGAD